MTTALSISSVRTQSQSDDRQGAQISTLGKDNIDHVDELNFSPAAENLLAQH